MLNTAAFENKWPFSPKIIMTTYLCYSGSDGTREINVFGNENIVKSGGWPKRWSQTQDLTSSRKMSRLCASRNLLGRNMNHN